MLWGVVFLRLYLYDFKTWGLYYEQSSAQWGFLCVDWLDLKPPAGENKIADIVRLFSAFSEMKRDGQNAFKLFTDQTEIHLDQLNKYSWCVFSVSVTAISSIFKELQKQNKLYKYCSDWLI